MVKKAKRISKSFKRIKSIFKRVKIRTWVALAFIAIVLPISLFAIFRPSETEAEWYDTAWLYRKKLTVDDAQVSGSTTLTNFPMLVSLSSDTDLSSGAQADGDDILFTDVSGNKLDHEVESYSTGTLVAWVKIPKLFASVDTSIYMYYGNATAASQQNATAVWDSNYVGVWHLGETVTDESTAGTHSDSTSNANNLTQNNNDDIAAKIGTGQNLDGTADYMTINDNASLSPGGTALTIQAWMYVPTSHVTNAIVVAKNNLSGSHTAPYFEYALNLVSTGKGDFFTATGTGGASYVRATDGTAMGLDGWHMMYGIYDGSNITLYIDTVQEGQTANTASLQNFTGPFRIGANGAPGEYTKAYVDEVRVAKTNRSTDWMTTEYNNQNSPSTFFTTGAQEQGSNPIAYWRFDEGVDNTCSGGSNDACDATTSGNDGAFGATTAAPTWQSENLCIKGKCLYFDGSNDTINVSNTVSGVKSVSFWVKPITTTEQFIDLNGSAYITVSTGTLSATGFTTPTYYIDGVATSSPTLTANKWQHVTVTTGTAISASAITIGNQSTNFGNQFMDEVKLFGYALSANQVKAEYTGGSVVLGTSDTKFLGDGLVGYWEMNDSVSGDAATLTDSSGNGKSGTTHYGANTTHMDCTVRGEYGLGCSLQTDDYISVASPGLPTGDFTYSIWVNLDNDSATDTILMAADGSGGNEIQAFLTAGNGVQLSLNNSQIINGSAISNSTWTHLVFTRKGSDVTLYINAAIDTTGTSSDTLNFSSCDLLVGVDADATCTGTLGEYFDGDMDSLRIYNRALTPKEVSDLYNWGPSPVAHYTFDENTGSTVYDYSGNAYSSTSITGTPSYTTGKYGAGMTFDGVDDYVTTSDPALGQLDILTKSWTYMLWVNVSSSIGTFDMPIFKDGAAIAGYDMELGTGSWTGNIRGGDATNYQVVFGTETDFLGNWTHLTVVLDQQAQLIKGYVNGILVSTASASSYTSANSTKSLILGATNTGTNDFSGKIDDIRIYDYARSPDQIVEDMNAGHPVGGSPIGSEAIYWKLDTGHSGTAYDTIGNQNGTITNATWLRDGSCKLNKCLNFDASGEVVTIATASDADVDFNTTEAFSGSAWVYVTTMPTSTGSDADAIIAKWDATVAAEQRGYRLYVENDDTDTTGNFEVQIYDESANQAITATGTTDGVSQNTWYHVAFTFNGGQTGTAGDLKLYVDGQYKAQNSANGSFLGLEDVTSDFTVGEYDATDGVSTDTAFTGRIDEVKMYAAELTAAQVKIDHIYGSSSAFSTGQVASSITTGGIGTAPVGDWSFDENTGTSFYDTSGSLHNGSWSTGLGWTNGKYGSAIVCDDTNVATVTDSADFDFAASGATVEAWFKTNGAITTTDFFLDHFSGGDPGAGWFIGMGSPGIVEARHRASVAGLVISNYVDLDSTAEYDDSKWHHMVWTLDVSSTVSDLYVDGKKDDTDTAFVSLGDYSADLGFCNSLAGTFDFNGYMDQIRIYKYVRTPSQIAYSYNRGAPRYWYKMDDCTGTTIYNSAQNANGEAMGDNGTLTVGAGGGNTSAGTCSTSGAWFDGVSGKRNYSIELDGNDDFITTSAFSPLAYAGQTTKNFSWGGWFYPTTSAASKTLVEKATEYRLTTDASSQPVCGIYYSAAFNDATAGSTALSLNAWNHVLCVYDGSNIYTYLNGRQIGSSAQTNSVTAASSILYIGENSSAAQEFEGKVDEQKLWLYDLSATQILNEYNQAATNFGPSTGHP